jgi:spore coat protein U-like protein
MTLLHRMTSPLRSHKKIALVSASLVGTLVLGLQPIEAMSATATATFTVSAVVPAACTISANAMSFGTYSGAALSTTSNINATCTAATPYTIALDAGTNPTTAGNTSGRRLANGTNYISYDLWQDAGHTTHWGNVTGTDTLAGTGSGSTQDIPVYGSLAAGTVPAPGTYSDTVTASITF